jgi:hypothetical protein
MSTDTRPAESISRADRFLVDLSDVKHDSSSRNALLSRVGALMLSVGVALALLGLLLSQITDNSLNQSTDVSLGLSGVALCLAGLALFLRYSFAQFLRFWLLRLIYEQANESDRGDVVR